jgi:hypothetical protein
VTGEVFLVDVKPSDTVWLVKMGIQAQSDLNPEEMPLTYSEKQLVDDKTLSYYGIGHGATIHLNWRLGVEHRPRRTSGINVPAESVFNNKEASETIAAWQKLGKEGDFDADTHLVAPSVHYAALDYLEQAITESSELYRHPGAYNFHRTPTRGQLSEPSSLLSKAPALIGDEIPDVQDDDILRSLSQSHALINSVIDRFDLLVSKKFSSDFFSILLLRDELNMAEIVKIRRTTLAWVANHILEAISLAQYRTKEMVAAFYGRALEVLFNMLGLEHTNGDVLETLRVLAYLLDLGLVCYVGSHGSRFDQEYFKRAIPSFSVNLDGAFSFDCQLRRLSCLNGFLNARKVWVFDVRDKNKLTTTPGSRADVKLSILTTIDVLADIWGPVYAELVDGDTMSAQTGRVKKYNVAKGCIRRIPDRASSPHAEFVNCHWYSWAEEQRRRLSRIITSHARAEDLTMSVDDKLLIGTEMRVNKGCDFSLQEYESTYDNLIREAGPRPSSWRFDGIAVSLQIAAPKLAMIQIEGQSKRLPEKTVKESAWQRWNANPERANPGILNTYYGVEISHCTGNARRVPLKRILLMEPVLGFLERQIPGWMETPWGKDFRWALGTYDDTAVFHFWNHHVKARSQVGRLVASVLDILDHTGVTSSAFQAALLHQNRESIVEFETKSNDWMSLLKDSYLMATYAIVNKTCLEYIFPDHTTSICNNERQYSVFQTEVRLEDKARVGDHIIINPLKFKVIDYDDRKPAFFGLLVPKSALQSMLRLRRTIEAKELVNRASFGQMGGRIDRYIVVLRASRHSYGGMRHQRNRGLLDAAREDNSKDTPYAVVDSAATQEALPQLENEASSPEVIVR